MDAEVEKLVEGGKLTARQADQLEKLRPGTFCLHKSWGFGRVAEWNLLLNQILIDFPGKKAHAMQLPYAADNVTPLSADHFLTRKATDMAGVRQLLKSDPTAVVRNVLESLGGSGTVGQISQMMVGDLFNETEWKRWWNSTTKALKKDGFFHIPTKKTEPIALRGEKVSRADELLTFFNQARQAKEQVAALDQIIKFHSEFEKPEVQLQPVIAEIEMAAARNQRLNAPLTFELVMARDDLLVRCPKLQTTNPELTLTRLVAEEQSRLVTILPKLPASKEKRVLQVFPAALGLDWTVRALQLLQSNNARAVLQIPRVFVEEGKQDELRAFLERGIRDHSLTSEILVWLCRERDGEWRALMMPDLLGAILSALERDQHNENSRGSKLRDLLLDDRELIPDMFSGADLGVARDGMRRLMLTPVFDELTKRSLLARIIKLYPELESVITGEQKEEKSEALVVSWSSLEKRKAEYEELVNKKIPENSKEIGIARSYGDLRENFEFKAAKEMQAVLMRRKSELEIALHNARGTAFESPDTSQVSIGTVVGLRDSDTGKEETYTVLGAWDGDPDRGIISYQTAIGQAMLGHKIGEIVTLTDQDDTRRYAIISIDPAPVDVTPPDPSLSEVPAEALVE
ncbi:MAG TPA: GreA/GreB family elongation factor [Chthoniobacterales bacterium]|jgi:transcription elongation GreA/GreB family factor|nr:GreA/GreB family elongation factor [Chthoniobacterales bacterium]